MADSIERTTKRSRCCELKSACGRSLRQGVVFVGITTLVVSVIVLLTSVVVVSRMTCKSLPYYSMPVPAVDIIFGLVTMCMSIYQMIISTLLLYQATKTQGNIYLCSVWYVSHLSILTVYFILFASRAIVCLKEKRYLCTAGTIVIWIIYEEMATIRMDSQWSFVCQIYRPLSDFS